MDVPRPHPNNGKITGQTDVTSGEQVVYTYDALNRLATAGSTSSSWGQSYSYDGFGNLQNQTVTAGTAPSLSVTYNASTNRQTTDSADANGNISSVSGVYYMYDVSNRIVSATGGISYSYAPGNKRIWKGIDGGSGLTTDVITFWSVNGQKLGDYNMSGDPTISYPPPSVPPLTAALATSYYYFGGKLIKNGGGYVGSDRLGSVGKFYPWGQEKPSATTNNTEKFTGYFRDSETGLDYAKNRYHQPGMGRFLSVDSGAPKLDDPGSWNRYSYAAGDPVNRVDPNGLDYCDPFDPNPDDPGCEPPVICAPGMVLNEYGECVLPGINPTVNFDPYVVDSLALVLGGIFSSATNTGNDVFQVDLSSGQFYQLAASGFLQVPPTVIPQLQQDGQILVTMGTAIIGAIIAWFESNHTMNWAGSVPTAAELASKCDLMSTSTEKARRRGDRNGGQSVEQLYKCPDGTWWEVHTIYNSNGTITHQHIRGPVAPPDPPGVRP